MGVLHFIFNLLKKFLPSIGSRTFSCSIIFVRIAGKLTQKGSLCCPNNTILLILSPLSGIRDNGKPNPAKEDLVK